MLNQHRVRYFQQEHHMGDTVYISVLMSNDANGTYMRDLLLKR